MGTARYSFDSHSNVFLSKILATQTLPTNWIHVSRLQWIYSLSTLKLRDSHAITLYLLYKLDPCKSQPSCQARSTLLPGPLNPPARPAQASCQARSTLLPGPLNPPAWPAQPSCQTRSTLLPGPLNPPARPVSSDFWS